MVVDSIESVNRWSSFRPTSTLTFSDYGIRTNSEKKRATPDKIEGSESRNLASVKGTNYVLASIFYWRNTIKLVEREMGGNDPTTRTQRSIKRDLRKLDVTGAQRMNDEDTSTIYILHYEGNIVSINWIKRKIKTWKIVNCKIAKGDILFCWFVAEQWGIIFLLKDKEKAKVFHFGREATRKLVKRVSKAQRSVLDIQFPQNKTSILAGNGWRKLKWIK